jgi:hypothetical protein
MWSWRPAPSGSSSGGPWSESLSAGGPPSPPPPPCLACLQKALKRVVRILPSSGYNPPSWSAPKGMDPPVRLDPSGGWDSSSVIWCCVVPSARVLEIVSVVVAICIQGCVFAAEYVAGVMVGVLSGPQGSRVLSGLPGWFLSMMTSELRICRVSCSSVLPSVVASSSKSLNWLTSFCSVPR